MAVVVATLGFAVSGAQATEWICGFSDFAGTDGTAVANYTDVDGQNPRTYSIWTASTNWANLAAGWLTQGDIGGGNKTAKFNNVADAKNGRARFGTALPATMDANGGVVVAWRMRVGPTNPGRGPIQICVTSDGAVHTPTTENALTISAFIRVRNNGGAGGSVIDILRNGGTSYSGATDPLKIDVLTLPTNISNEWHQWTAAVIRDTTTGYGYWKLWLDGAQLLFTGSAGSPTFDPDGAGPEPSQQFSFATKLLEGFDGTVHNEPYIGLGDLNSQDAWDFEFDCVAYRDDGIGAFTCETTTPACDAGVSPSATETRSTLKALPVAPVVYTFTNTGSVNTGYTVATSDAAGTTVPAATYPWLSLDKAGKASVEPLGGTDQVTATITDTNLAAGTYTAYLTFKTTCTPAVIHTRRIDLVITDCAFGVSPNGEVARSVTIGSVPVLADAVYTVTNTGTDGLTWHVEKEGADSGWLSLSKAGGGPINNGATDTMTVSFQATGVAVGLHTCNLRFSCTKPGCSNSPPDILCPVVLNVLNASSGLEQFVAEFTTFTGSDATSSSPVISCDPNVSTMRAFELQPGGALQVDQLDPGWLTQGSLDGEPTTAKFNNPPGAASGGLSGVGRARFRTFLPFDSSYDPAKGMAVAWRMRVGNYNPTRGPVQITFPRVPGPFGTSDTLAIPGEVFNCYVRLNSGSYVTILRNGGGQYAGINTLTLPVNIADQYHQWTASVCYSAADQFAYWNLWLDGQKLLFTGSNADGSAGSPVGPGGAVFSFRTFLENVSPDPYIGLGEQQSSIDIWDFEFDWVRLLSYNVAGCPFWDGEGCVTGPLCNTPFADADGDHDVDMLDFAALQRCINTGLYDSAPLPEECRCFDRNRNRVVGDAVDLTQFIACGTGTGVPWASRPGCE
jgi:hypothetical protein